MTPEKAIRAAMIGTAALLVLLSVAGRSARAEARVALPDGSPQAASELATEGRAPRSRALQMQVYPKPRSRAQLDRLLDALQDPSSPQYRRFLSASEYRARFAPAQRHVE